MSHRPSILALALALDGCAAITGPRAAIEDRFRHQLPWSSDQGSVAIDVFTSDIVEQPPSIALTALSDRGQAAMIRQSGGKPPISLKGADDAKTSTVALDSSIKRHVVVAVRTPAYLSPGDRVDAIHVDLSVLSGGGTVPWRITSWTQASNGQTVIDVGKSTDTSASKVTASTGLKISSVLPGATLGGETDRTRSSETEVKDTTDFDAAVDNQGHAWLDETAGWRVNLAHNLSMDVVLSAPATSLVASPLVSANSLTRDDPRHKGGTLAAFPEDVRLTEVAVYSAFANEARPICGHADLAYRIRRIRNAKGAGTFSESDDDVQFATGTARADFLLAPPSYRPTYVLRSNDLVMSYQMPGAPPSILAFSSLDAATTFARWFVHASPRNGRIGGDTVVGLAEGARIIPLTRGEIARLAAAPQSRKLLEAALNGAYECPWRGAPSAPASIGSPSSSF